VGESTFGKGTVQTVLDLKRFINDKEEVGELKLTFQKFYRVTGSSTQIKGVSPDIALPSALNTEQYGEGARPNALPWDLIKGTSYHAVADVNDKVIAGLSQSYHERMKYDEMLRKNIRDTEELKKSLSQTKISLNEQTRRIEMEEAQRKKAQNDNLDTQVTSKEGLPATEILKMEDEFLREGLLILSDLVTKRIG
jgi:carboxyl-terminal processing protease